MSITTVGKTLISLLFVPMLTIGFSGCGTQRPDGIATAGGVVAQPATPWPPPAADRAERQRQYAECLRQHGVEVADASQEKGQENGVQVTESNLPQAKEAARACQRYAPSIAGQKDEADIGRLRDYASCIRQHGVSNFPDPDPTAGLLIPKSIVSLPEYEAADRICTANAGKTGTSSTS